MTTTQDVVQAVALGPSVESGTAECMWSDERTSDSMQAELHGMLAPLLKRGMEASSAVVQLFVTLQRERLAEQKERVRMEAEVERLRTSLGRSATGTRGQTAQKEELRKVVLEAGQQAAQQVNEVGSQFILVAPLW